MLPNLNETCFRLARGTVHKEFTNEDEDYDYEANPYNKCSPEYGCPKISWTVDLDSADENFECPIFDMPSKKGILYQANSMMLSVNQIEACYRGSNMVLNLNTLDCNTFILF